MKKKVTLALVVTILVEITCCFIPAVFIRKYWFYDGRGYTTRHYDSVNIFDGYSDTIKILGIITIVFLVLSVVAFLLLYLKKGNILTRFAGFSTIPSFLLIVLLAVIALTTKMNWGEGYFVWQLSWMYYIIALLNIVSTIFALLLQFNRIKETEPLSKVSVTQAIPQSNADELQKYKNLLDNGAITQEEYEAKKKQILGL